MLFEFHNNVNARTNSPQFSYDELLSKYKQANFVNIVNNLSPTIGIEVFLVVQKKVPKANIHGHIPAGVYHVEVLVIIDNF